MGGSADAMTLDPHHDGAVRTLICQLRFVHAVRPPDDAADAQLAVESLVGMGYDDANFLAKLVIKREREIERLREQLRFAEHRYEETDQLLWEAKQAA